MNIDLLTNASTLPRESGTIGEHFDIFYGQKELHSRDGIPSGDSLVVSPTEEYNGCYGWLSFENLIQAPFVTVAQTGTIGEAFVQMEPCGVNDDCLILLILYPSLRHGSNECDSFERSSQSKINPEAAQEGISEFIFHRLDCSKLSR